MCFRPRRSGFTPSLAFALPCLVVAAVGARPQPAAAQTAEAPVVSIERLYEPPRIIGTAPREPVWSRDGRRLAFLWNDEGRNFMDVWTWSVDDPEAPPARATRMASFVQGASTVGRALGTDAFPTPSEAAVAESRLRDRMERDPGVGTVSWHPDGDEILFTLQGDLWTVVPGDEPRRLTRTPERESGPGYAPEGDRIAFRRDGDVWLIPRGDAATGTRGAAAGPGARRLTRLAAPDVRVTNFRWSPDGSRMAILVSDEGTVPARGIPDYLSEETRLRNVRRAYPGEATARLGLAVLDATGAGAVPGAAEIPWIPLSAGGQDEGTDAWRPDLILDYRWSPDGSRIAIDTGGWTAKDRRVLLADAPFDGEPPRLAYREADPDNRAH